MDPFRKIWALNMPASMLVYPPRLLLWRERAKQLCRIPRNSIFANYGDKAEKPALEVKIISAAQDISILSVLYWVECCKLE